MVGVPIRTACCSTAWRFHELLFDEAAIIGGTLAESARQVVDRRTPPATALGMFSNSAGATLLSLGTDNQRAIHRFCLRRGGNSPLRYALA